MGPMDEGGGMEHLLGEVLADAGLRQLRIAETQKFRHVTSFFNGKATTPFLVTPEWGYTPMGAGGWCELYDMRADPLATTNLAAEHPGEIVALYELLLAHLEEHNAPEAMRAAWQHSEQASDGVWAIDYPDTEV